MIWRIPGLALASSVGFPTPTSTQAHLKPDSNFGDPLEERGVSIEYPEGSDVGYRWHARKGYKPLFTFGYGLRDTQFQTPRAAVRGFAAKVEIYNTGTRAGADVA